MAGPLTALLILVATLVAAVVLLWPDRGLVWRALRALRATERVLAEDALKHAFDCDYRGRSCSLESLAGALSIPASRAAEVVRRLEERELLTAGPGGYRLTAEGRTYALRVVRIHRLWERYLSDRTGLDPAAWHGEAELLEHTTSVEEAAELSAAMGDPRYDPHGDPIPTETGEIAPPRGMPLTELEPDVVAEIVHVEDEPETIYAQLVAAGLHPGVRVRVVESGPRRIRFEADAEECVLAPVLAANLSVAPLPPEETMEGPFERLSSLAPGDRGRVVGLAPSLHGLERRRMLDLGLVPGTEVAAELRAPGGDPTGYRIRGALIALRREQADSIQIEALHEVGTEAVSHAG